VFDFLYKLFGRESSSATAKERLRLVLLSDHLSLAPDVVESLKHDLVEVISRYVEVDEANCDVSFEQQDKQVAMLANIPILGMKSRPTPPAAPPTAPEPPPSLGNPAGASASVASEPEPETTVSEPAQPGAVSRRRRKKRRASNATIAPQPG
jgi:cell division topological specificity factor